MSALPDHAIAALRLALKGAVLVDAESAFEVERSVPHGNAATAHVMAGQLGLRALLGGLPLYRYRDLLEHLETLDREVINFAGQQIENITTPTPVQARAFDLLGSPVPARLT